MRNRLGIFSIGLSLALLALLVAVWTGERQARAKLLQEKLDLERQVEAQGLEARKFAAIQAENERLALVKVASDEMDRLRQEHSELLRLRAENARMREGKGMGAPLPVAPPGTRTFRSGPATYTYTPVDDTIDPQREPEFQQQLASPGNPISWSPGQAAGAPDTDQAGDLRTAWAAQNQDGGAEWLKLEYERPMELAQVRVRETYNPGAVSSITAILENGSEVTLWEGEEPKSQAPVEMEFNVPTGIVAKQVTVHLDTARVPGWNEIDAVELVGRDGTRQWAKSATASSYFGERQPRNYNMRGQGRGGVVE